MFENFNLAMLLSETGILEAVIAEILLLPHIMMFIEKGKGAKKVIHHQIQQWKDNVTQELSQIELSDEFKQEIISYKEVQTWDPDYFSAHLPHLITTFENESGFYLKARSLSQLNMKKPSAMLYREFMQTWQKYLVDKITELQKDEIEIHKEKLLADIYKRIENSDIFLQLSEKEDMEMGAPLWDMSKATLKKQKLPYLKKIAAQLKKNPQLLDIAENIGRSAQSAVAPDALSEKTTIDEIHEVERDNIPDDVVGVYPHDDISRMLASESVYLSDPELEILFYKELVEKQLLNYQFRGIEEQHISKTYYQNSTSKQMKPKGPFIICLDVSGSMQGQPEKLAKALTLALMQIALEQQRDAKLMIFSKDFIDYDLTGKTGVNDLLDFMSYTFHGGTDLEPVLARGINLMYENRFQNADMVVISDFIAPSQPVTLFNKVKALKNQENRIHAITLSPHANPSVMRIFDKIWHFTPSRFHFF